MRRILTAAAAAALVAAAAPPAWATSGLGGDELGGDGFGGDVGEPAPVPAGHDRHGHRAPALGTSDPATPDSAGTGELSSGNGTAQEADWSFLGPPGGDVTAVAVSPADSDLALAGLAPNRGSGGTLYVSDDGGASWREDDGQLAGTSVLDIGFSPDGDAYLATEDGVWSSDDGAASWTHHGLGIGANQFVYALTVDPHDPETLWASVADAQQQQSANLVRSTDAGATWQDVTPPMTVPLSGRGVAVHPSDPDTVVAVFGGTIGGGNGVWVSTDGGDSWQDRAAGLPSTPVRTVAYDGDRLLVGGGQLFGQRYFGLYASTDLGQSWSSWHDSQWPVPVVEDVAVDPDDPAHVLVATDGTGVHRTTDGGDSWELSVGGTGALAARTLGYTPGSGQELFLGVDSLGVYRSTDGGDTFASSADGMTELNLTSVAANPDDPAELAVTFEGQNSGGVLTSSDAGETWEATQVPATRYSAVGFSSEGVLHALSSGPTTVADEGLYRREADGEWTPLGPDQGPNFEADLSTLAFSADEPDHIMLGGADFGAAGDEATIWRSTDGGDTWDKVYEAGSRNLVPDVEFLPGADGAVAGWYSVSGDNAGGVLHSGDNGETWAAADGLPGNDYFRSPQLCADADEPDTVYAAAWRGFSQGQTFRSHDGGVSWEPTGWDGARTADVVCDPVDDVVYLATGGDDTVLRSDDQGATFTAYADGLDQAAAPGQLSFAGDYRLLLATGQGSFGTQVREAPEPPPAPEVCDRTVTGVHDGPLVVDQGTTCVTAGAHVLGEVTVGAGAGLRASAAVVQGPVSAFSAATVELEYTQVTGPVTVAGASGSAELFASQVTGGVVLSGSVTPEPAVVAGNTVIGALSCTGNEPAPVDSGLPNTASAGAYGQCAALSN